MRITANVHIAAPPDAVAAVLADASRAPDWQHGLARMEVVHGGANEVGSLARLHYQRRGRSYTMEDRLIACEPYRTWRSRVSGHGMAAIVETRLVPRGSGTDVHLTWEGRPDGRVARLVFPLFTPFVRRGIRRDLQALRRCVEGSAGAAVAG